MINASIPIAPPLRCLANHFQICWLATAIAFTAVWVGELSHAQTPPTPVLPRVSVEQVVISQVTPTHRVVGTVNPVRTSIIGSAVAGRVEAVLIEVGDAIKKGDEVSHLRRATMEIELAAANAELDLARSQLSELENGPLPEDVAEAEALAMGAKSSMQNASTSLRRLRALINSGAATMADIEAAEEQAAISEYAFRAAEAARKRTEQGPRIEQIDQARARLALQKQNVELIKDRMDKLTIVSPFDGFVSAKFTEVGAWINIGDPVVQIIELGEVEIVAPTMAQFAVNLKRDDTVRVEFPEIPGEVWTGVVHRVVPVADSRARTYPVTIRLKNVFNEFGDPELLSGMLARVVLSVGKPVTGPIVPKDALVLDKNERSETRRSVFVIESTTKPTTSGGPPKTGIARRVAVELGAEVGGLVQVIGELNAGDYVVTLGNERLVPNKQVEVVEDRTKDAGASSP